MGNDGAAALSFSERLAAVRAEMRKQNLAAFLVPRSDEHLGEYVPASAERLAWLTGFTGSAGLAVVFADHAAVWSDGRYVLQLASETDGDLWERLHLQTQPPPRYVARRVPVDGVVGYDPWLMSEDQLARYREAGLTLSAVAANPVDLAWQVGRPAAPMAPAVAFDLQYAGKSAEEKRRQVAELLTSEDCQAAVLSDPASIAWLLNIRGADIGFVPVPLGFAIVHADAAVELFMAPEKLPQETRAWLGNGVAAAPREALPDALAALSGQRVRLDIAGAPAWFAETLRGAGATLVPGQDPCLALKASKNGVEQEGARAAQLRDGVALCRFLQWVEGAAGHETEMSAAGRLLQFRQEGALFRGESFPAISAAGEHGAIMHYRVSEATDRAILPDETYLIDSGAQYLDGTTDVTRTIWTGPGLPTADLREKYTRVLKGHIAIATLIFPEGVAGVRLDAFARAALWQVGLDFDHGTGHGVGSYLSVHEGPASLSPHLRAAPLAQGMILSNEPGFYLPGEYGIRLENLLLVRDAGLPNATRPFLRFETLTWAPFDRVLIEPALLTDEECRWLNAYHATVLAKIGPQLPAQSRDWLAQACAALAA